MDTSDLTELTARAGRLATPGHRRILGIAGPPGAGKSTLAARLVDALGGRAVLVPMDGFHLARAELDRLGRADRKGAPDTFDAAGYAALLRRLRDPDATGPVYAPAFDRALEEPVAGSLPVPPDVPLVVTEGNYLLHDDEAWAPVRGLLDEVWFLDLDPEERVRRLVERHVRFGKPRPYAERWVAGSDGTNARLVDRGRDRADLLVRLRPAPRPDPGATPRAR
ncbi:nucleoside/nucleotide kinase family protein [Streptomyces sp. BE308]|uniref:nucleoside/nucleotide kinase family protein n=1 Tax=unclassified Streptomyces TaxID=2593676 RepID=UPI002DDBEB20|nr:MULTISPECIES: nucleoside/nucleotide kinase family protein [unclassified Streptomyces]MEE1791929.1 nucleoside/nucleotide kinase family protein [Streptomyces sp. BE308]WRZ75851.1 nucleoside/nucleotide kinase family protein [Streptomyces sp. NBC_01237]